MPSTDSNLTSQIPKRVKNLTGKRFTRLLVLGYAGQFHSRAFWHCLCDCKSYAKVEGIKLRSGHSRSCGCYKNSLTAARSRTHGLTVNRQKPRIFRLHSDMLTRCYNPNATRYSDYGGRGIRVCERWHAFISFYMDMSDPPSAEHSIDRIENGGHYSCGKCEECVENEWPMNVRWATRTQQARNKRNNRLLTHNNETLCAERTGLPSRKICSRSRAGWSDSEALGFVQRTGTP